MKSEKNSWHDGLEYASEETMGQTKRENLAMGMNSVCENKCESCVEGKTCRKSHLGIEGRRAKCNMEP